jgi:integrase/recombinase XerD
MTKSAKVLATGDVRRLMSYAKQGRYGLRNQVMVLLSCKAGLRAAEIAGADWSMIVSAAGKVDSYIHVGSHIAKYQSGRTIPLNPELRKALVVLHRIQGRPSEGAVVQSERGGHMTPGSVVNWFRSSYARLNMRGCSSHSGRRTFITRSARLLAKAGGSLRDVQELAGHRALTTTERYIEGDRDAQRKLVRLV